MFQLTGEYECKMDAKGRIKLPAGLIRQLSGSGSLSFVINRGFEKCLMLYPKQVWDKKTQEVNQLNIYNPKERQFIRYFYRGATEVSTDSAERILVPKSLIEYALLDKELMLLAYHEQIEIWSKDRYAAMLETEPEEFSELAAEVFGNRQSPGTD
ncbi:MAG: division/cell wall cluster transcriptional repressor MraZ [Saprospiraceae bacterium]|nr:division/cell wall cluster transcriptional repressor MraZ [Saprospiraceae bacterium]